MSQFLLILLEFACLILWRLRCYSIQISFMVFLVITVVLHFVLWRKCVSYAFFSILYCSSRCCWGWLVLGKGQDSRNIKVQGKKKLAFVKPVLEFVIFTHLTKVFIWFFILFPSLLYRPSNLLFILFKSWYKVSMFASSLQRIRKIIFKL